MATPLAYIRRSRVFADKPGAVSHEAQTSAVVALAARHGYTLRPEDVLEDWGRSGGAGKEHRRPSYQTLRAAVEAGTVSDVFAYDLSRLTRSLEEWSSLAASCTTAHVRVHLVTEGTFDFSTASGEMVANILASVAQAVRRWAQERAVQTVAHRRTRGDYMGPPRYGWRADGRDGHAGVMVPAEGEDVGAVVAAFRETGTYNRAARMLNAAGVPSKRSGTGSIWRAAAVRRVIEREAPALIPRNVREGAPARTNATLAGLLRCPCGGILTPARTRHGTMTYRCQRSFTMPDHPRPASVPESRVLPWVRADVERITSAVLPDGLEMATDNAAQRERLTGRLERAHELYIAGEITRERHVAETEAVAAQLAKLADVQAIVALPAIDWTWNAVDLNAILRTIYERIELGPDMRPLGAVSRIPGMEN